MKQARYEETNTDGSRVWQAKVNGPLTRNGEEVRCQWIAEGKTMRLVDQWDNVHQTSYMRRK